ncbi:MAG: SseB family protein, partial [Clostridia bacterium]|nr:SseB family protein [Clostridia bacterium]
ERFGEQIDETVDRLSVFNLGNYLVERAIDRFHADTNKLTLIDALDAICDRMLAGGRFIMPVLPDENDPARTDFLNVKTDDNGLCPAAFTSLDEYTRGPQAQMSLTEISAALKATLDSNRAGLIINPWGNALFLSRQLVEMLFKADGTNAPGS